MITLEFGSGSGDCSACTRRDLLVAGGAAVLMGPGEQAWAETVRRDRAVVLVFLAGGPSHIETFSPNPGGTDPYRSATGWVKTGIPGMELGGSFPRLARLARRLFLVRSFQHRINDHVQAISHVLTGGSDPTGQARAGYGMGAAAARLGGASHPRTGLPAYALLTSPHRDGQYAQELGRVERGSRGGDLGAACDPYRQATDAEPGIRLHVPAGRLEGRRRLLDRLDAVRSRVLAGGSDYAQLQSRAFGLLAGDAARAFDIRREPARTLERYDTSDIQVGKKVFQPSTLGHQMLLARRLVEHGARFVTVQSAGWDMHADGNNPGIAAGMRMLGTALDRAASAFLADVTERGLLDDVLLVITGDFGRTPRINANGGRDHWARLSTLALAGGDMPGGAVWGEADATNSEPAADAVGPEHLFATVLHHLFDAPALRARPDLPEHVARILSTAPPLGRRTA